MSSLSFTEEMEQLFTAAAKTITDSSLTFDEAELRLTIATQLAKARGEPIPEGLGKAAEPTKPDAPVVDVNAGGALLVDDGKPVETKGKKKEPFWWQPKEDEEFEEWFIKARMSGYLPEGQLLYTGPSGQAKTMGVVRLFDRLGVPLNIVNCASITTIEKWIGHREVDNTGTHFILSEFLRMVEAKGPDFVYPDGQPGYPPGGILLDELSRLHATFHNVLYPIMDGQRQIYVPEMHGYVTVGPQVIVLATANVGARYTGTFTLDLALQERFSYTIERGYPPKADEVKVITSRVNIEDAKAKLMVDIAQQTRTKMKQGDLSAAISTRQLLNAARVVAAGGSVARAFEVSALTRFPDDGNPSERTIVKGIIAGKSS